MLRIILNNLHVFWALLAIPAMVMLYGYFTGRTIAMDMVPPTGEWAARFTIFAMALSPLVSLIGPRSWLDWLVQRRRALGLAAFGYALLHLLFYLIDMGALGPILAEFWATGIWTGWAAVLLFVPVALSSNNASMRALKAGWKRLQRLVYPVALLTLVHWVFIHDGIVEALIYFTPLLLLIVARALKPHFPQAQKQGV